MLIVGEWIWNRQICQAMVLLDITDGSKTVSLYVDNDNGFSIDTLRSAYPDATNLINPNYGARMVLLSIHDGKIYNPDGWDSNAVYSIYIGSRAPTPVNGSRPATPVDQVPSPMMIDLPASPNEELTIERMKNYVYTVDGIVACATAITDNVLASCYHCVKHFVTIGPNADEIQSHRDAVIDLTHAVKIQKIQVKIRAYSIENDIVLLQSDENLMANDELQFRHAYFGQPYYLLGTPISDDGNPLQVLSGRISAKLEGNLLSVGHSLHGHGSARPGASGGPVFGRQLLAGKPSLLGIVAAGQTISHQTMLLTFISSNYVKIISTGTLHDAYLLSEKGFFKLN